VQFKERLSSLGGEHGERIALVNDRLATAFGGGPQAVMTKAISPRRKSPPSDERRNLIEDDNARADRSHKNGSGSCDPKPSSS
jgi:hypothetical protein